MKLSHIVFWVALIIIIPKIIVSVMETNHCDDLYEPDRTIKDCTTLIENGTNPFSAYNNRAMARSVNKQYKQAIDDYTKALTIEPKNIATLIARGDAHRKNGQNDKALADFNQTIEINPKFANGYYNRGALYLLMKDADKAESDIDKALELSPDFVLAHHVKGSILVARGQGGDAIPRFDTVIKARPQMFEAFALRGIAYFQTENFQKALQDLNVATEHGYKEDKVFLVRGMVKQVLASPSAINDFAEAVANNRDKAYPAIWLHLAKARAGKDDLAEFKKNSDLAYSDPWQKSLTDFFLEKLSEDNLYDLIKTDDEATQKIHLCDVHFYAAEFYVLKGLKDKAVENFKKSEHSCPASALERALIKSELRTVLTAR